MMPPPVDSTSSEDSDEAYIGFDDITNFFPYLKNLEDQVLDSNDYCIFPSLVENKVKVDE
jgi:hypothetical protein